MSMEKRSDLIPTVSVDRNKELDLLRSKVATMDLPTARQYMIKSHEEGKPDKIAKKTLGSFHLGWLLLYHNDIFDPFNELKKGTLIDIPDVTEYFSFYMNNMVEEEDE